jgi:hypothetical protein
MGLLLCMFVLQYQKELFARLSPFRTQADPYAELESEQSATDR